MEFSDMQWPPPKDWEKFEDFCWDLYKSIWNDPNTKKHGRKGQAQASVDIFGTPSDKDGLWGVQCKKKDILAGTNVSEEELKNEVENAKKFKPPLSCFILATTGARDAKIQELAREISAKHKSEGLFEVHCASWEDLTLYFDEFPDVAIRQYGEAFRTLPQVLPDEIRQGSRDILGAPQSARPITPITASIPQSIQPAPAPVDSGLQSEFSAELDHTRDMLNQGHASKALELLLPLKERIWKSPAPPEVRFGVLGQLGSGYLATDEEKTAAKLFIEAHQYQPDDEKSLTNRALGHLLQGEKLEAQRYAKDALGKNPTNETAFCVLIQGSDSTADLESIINLVPKAHRDNPRITQAIARHARIQGDLKNAIKWAEVGIANDDENDPHLKAYLGELLLDEITNSRPQIYVESLSREDEEKLKRIIGLLDSAWNQAKKSDIYKFRSSWVVNRGVAKKFSGDIEGGISDIDTALELNPDNPIYIRTKAMFAFESGDTEKAKTLLKTIQLNEDVPEATLFYAELLSKEPDGKAKALPIVTAFLDKFPDSRLSLEARFTLIHLNADLGEHEKAENLINELLAESPNDIQTLIVAADLLRTKGDADGSAALVLDAHKNLKKESSFKEKLKLGDALYSNRLFGEAAEVYGQIGDLTSDNPITRKYLNACLQSHLAGRALEVCKEIRRREGPKRYVCEMESTLYEEIGDLPNAIAVCKEYLAVEPADSDVILRLATVLFRADNPDEVVKILSGDFKVEDLDLSSSFLAAQLLCARGQEERAMDIGYKARRKFDEESDAHLKYVSLFMHAEKGLASIRDTETIKPGHTVTYEGSDGNKYVFTIEDRGDASFSRREISPEHRIAKLLLGRKKGDTITLQSDTIKKSEAKIIDVRHKFVAAYQETFSDFEGKFPGTPGLWKIPADMKSKKEGELPPLLANMKAQLESQRKAFDRVFEQYKKGSLTIGAVAQLIRKSTLEAFWGMASKSDVGIKCCVGTAAERKSAQDVLATNKGPIILDPTAILSIFGLEIQDALPKTGRDLVVSQSTIDEFRQALIDRQGGPKERGHTSLSTEDDKILFRDVSDKEIEKSLAFLKGILKWIKSHCSIKPCNLRLKIPRDRIKWISKTLGDSFIDSILIAEETNGILYSDDERLRSFAANEHKVQGVWTQTILSQLLSEGRIDQEKFEEGTITLVCTNFHHTTLDARVILRAAKMEGYKPTGRFRTTIKTLSGGKTDDLSTIVVSVNFLYLLEREPIGPHERDILLTTLLGEVTLRRDKKDFLEQFSIGVKARFSILPLAEERILRIVEAWGKTLIQ